MSEYNKLLENSGFLLKEASKTIRTQEEENKNLRVKVAYFERLERARSLVKTMDQETLGDDPDTYAQKLAQSNEDFDVLERALEFRAEPQQLLHPSTKTASVRSLDSDEESESAREMRSWLQSSVSRVI